MRPPPANSPSRSRCRTQKRSLKSSAGGRFNAVTCLQLRSSGCRAENLCSTIRSSTLSSIPPTSKKFGRFNSQRFEMEQLTAVVYENEKDLIAVGYKDVGRDEFWARGHMPGMPIMPGVVMCEAAAQLCSYVTQRFDLIGATMLGLGGFDEVRFRDIVVPGDRLVMIVQMTKKRRGALVIAKFQGFVRDAMVLEGTIRGIPLPVEHTPDGPKLLAPERRRRIVRRFGRKQGALQRQLATLTRRRRLYDYSHRRRRSFPPLSVSDARPDRGQRLDLLVAGQSRTTRAAPHDRPIRLCAGPGPYLFGDPNPVAAPLNLAWQDERGERRLVGQVKLPPDRGDVLLSLITCMFLHGGWAHIIGNMWFLWLFGDNVEDRLGPVTYLVFYLVGGLAASACHWFTDPSSTTPVVGASGAVAAVLGAYAVTYPWANVHAFIPLFIVLIPVDIPAIAMLGMWFVMQLLEGFKAIHIGLDGGVAWWAHVGGFVAGAVLMPLLRDPPPPTPRVRGRFVNDPIW